MIRNLAIVLLSLCLQVTASLAATSTSSPYYLLPAPQHQNTSRDQVPTTQTKPGSKPPSQQPRTPRTVNIPLPLQAHFSPQLQPCTQKGNIVSFNGNQLQALKAYQFKIQTDKMPSLIKPISLNPSQIAFKLSQQLSVTAGRTYAIHITHTRSQKPHPESPLKIRLCPTDKNSQTGFTLQREPNQILAFSPITQTQRIVAEASQLGLQLAQVHPLESLKHDLLLLHGDEKNLSSLLKQLKNRFPEVDFDFNHHYSPAAKPREYAAKMIRWPDARPCLGETNTQPLAIGLVDGLPDVSHPALKHQTIMIQSFLNQKGIADKQHGTAIAGILAGQTVLQQNQSLLSNIHILSALVLRHEKQKSLATTSSIVQALNWLLNHHVRLVNISIAGKQHNTVLNKMIAHAIKNKMIIFAAVGNDAMTDQLSYPAALPNVFAITAVDAAKRSYQHANRGTYIDFAAPGVDIWTLSQTGQGKYRSGTSYASPYAMAIAAMYLVQNKAISREEIYNAMKENTDDLGKVGQDKIFGWGLVKLSKELCPKTTSD